MLKKIRTRKQGFTLIELMIVVAIIGVLIALALPAFVNYFRRTKTAEVGPSIRNMFSGAAAYYLDPHWNIRAPTRGVLASSDHCTIAPGAYCTPNSPTADKQTVDLSDVGASPGREFAAVGFSISDPIYYQYCVEASGLGCGNRPVTALYTFSAIGDLDDDNVNSTFEIQAGASESNELYRTPGMFIVNELE